MRVAAIGNYGAPWTTEVHLRRALELNGHEVTEYQENEPVAWANLANEWRLYDFVLWTRTWDVPALSDPVMRAMKGSVPIIGYHLDRWWGLAREREIGTQAFFRWCDVICTADGGHDQQWADAGITHWWYPPGVLGEEAAVNVPWPSEVLTAPEILFVGSHRGYHPEWVYRMELVKWLRATYGARVTWFPVQAEHYVYEWRGREVRSGQIRGEMLNMHYQAAKVVVGDSCLAGGATRYWSDRVPETIGRGGWLVHPTIGPGIGHSIVPYTIGDFDSLRNSIEWAIANHDAPLRAGARARVLKHDTYEARMEQLVSELEAGGLI